MRVVASDPGTRLGAVPADIDRIVRNSTFNLLGQGLYAVCYLAAILLLTRVLGKELLGEYFTLFALILVVQLVIEAGTTTALTRRLAHEPEDAGQIVREAAGLCCVVAAVSFVAFLALGGACCWWRDDWALWASFAGAGLSCAALQVQRFCAGVFRAREMFRAENLAKVLQGAAFACLVTVLALCGLASLAAAVAALAASHVLAAAFLVASLWGHSPPSGCRISASQMKDWLGEAVPVGFGDVVRGLTWQLDTVLLALLQPAAVVGIYSVAYRPLGPLNWLPRAVLTAIFPSFARMAAGNGAALDRAFANSVRLLWIVSLPIAISVCICAEPLILILGGPDYLEAVLPMRILIWIAVLSFISIQFRFLFAAVGRQHLFARLVLVVFLIEVLVEAALIPRWGYLGACAGSVLGELAFTASGLLLCRKLGINGLEWAALARAALAGMVMAVPLWFARAWPLATLGVAVACTTVCYFALCVVFGALRWEEARRFFAAFAGRAGSRASGGCAA